MNEERFAVIYKQTSINTRTEILVDTQTGVQYLFRQVGYGGGMTPLLDREGKPLIAPTGTVKPQ